MDFSRWSDAKSHRTWQGLIATLVKVVVINLMKLNRVNPSGNFGPSMRWRDVPHWSRLAELFGVYFTIKLIICAFIHHEYNQLVSKLDAIHQQKQQQQQQQAEAELNVTYLNEIQAQFIESERRLDLVGSPWRKLGYISEVAYATTLIGYLAIYFGTRIYFAIAGTSKVGILCYCLEPEKEMELVNEEACRQTNKLIASMEIYLQACWDVRCKLSRSSSLVFESQHRDTKTSGRFSNEIQATLTHSALVCMVTRLHRANELIPMNRRPAWLTCSWLQTCSAYSCSSSWA